MVLLLGQLGTFAMEMLLSDFEILAVLHRLILIIKSFLKIKLELMGML